MLRFFSWRWFFCFRDVDKVCYVFDICSNQNLSIGIINFTAILCVLNFFKKSDDHWLTLRFLTTRISVRIFDRSEVIQNRINFVKNCPRWGWNPWTPDHYSNALPTELGRNCWAKDVWTELCSCTISHFGLHLFLESMEHKGLNDSYREPNSELAQLVDH